MGVVIGNFLVGMITGAIFTMVVTVLWYESRNEVR